MTPSLAFPLCPMVLNRNMEGKYGVDAFFREWCAKQSLIEMHRCREYRLCGVTPAVQVDISRRCERM